MCYSIHHINPVECKGIIIVPHRIIWNWYTGRWWVGCYTVYGSARRGTGRGRSPPRPLLVVPNVRAHPSTASVPITVLLYSGPLFCGFNVPIKWLNATPPYRATLAGCSWASRVQTRHHGVQLPARSSASVPRGIMPASRRCRITATS